MRFVSKELRVVHPCVLVVWVSQALPRRLTVGTGSRAPPAGLREEPVWAELSAEPTDAGCIISGQIQMIQVRDLELIFLPLSFAPFQDLN